MTELPRRDGPSEAAIRRALQVMADAYNELDPEHHYMPHMPGDETRPGAVILYASTPPEPPEATA